MPDSAKSTRIIHISDIHFGAHNPEAEAVLIREINSRAPELVVLSGDLTQTGSRKEFSEARRFINAIKAPVFCVPGNHDIPHYNLWARLTRPYDHYRHYVNPEINPVTRSHDMVLAGLNSARPILPHWNWAHGKISRRQIADTAAIFNQEPAEKLRILVCHHPLQKAIESPLKTIVWGARHAITELLATKTDLILTGHVHHASVTMIEDEGEGDKSSGHRIAAIAASTAISTRIRNHDNGYNIITITDKNINVHMMRWNGRAYETLEEHIIRRNVR